MSVTAPRPRADLAVAGLLVGWALVAGLLGGWLWMQLWQPPTGRIVNHTWYPDPWVSGYERAFSATAWFALLGVGTGLISGVVCALIRLSTPIARVGAVVATTVLSTAVMYGYGLSSAPADPARAAGQLPDGTAILGTLVAPGWSALAAAPLAGLLVIATVLLSRPTRAA